MKFIISVVLMCLTVGFSPHTIPHVLAGELSGSLTDRERREFERSDDEIIEQRIDHLLGEMTLAEKVGQMLMINISEINRPDDARYSNLPRVDVEKFLYFINEYHVGSFLNGIAVPPAQWYAFSLQIQELNLKNHRLKIPVIYGIDHIHGANYISGGTIFPHMINIAATFRPEYAHEMGRITGLESADLGHHWIFAPIMDLGRNPAFPRLYETAGEDPYLAGLLGAAFVRGLQQNEGIQPYRQAATPKHFIGYSDPVSGWDRTPADISDQTLQEFHVPPFQATIDAGAHTVMIQGGEVNSEPVHASYKLLTGLLRDQMGFTGVVVTDWEDVERLWTYHNVVENLKEAVFVAVQTGIDVSMAPYDPSFHPLLIGLVQEGRISEERIDLSVARILRLKLQLGLFDYPFPRNDRFDRIGYTEHQKVALNAARESLVLMKNDKALLPISPDSKIVLTGMNANNKRGLTGGWTYEWIPGDDILFPEEMPTIFEGLQQKFNVVLAVSTDDIQTLSNDADYIVVATGEPPYAEGYGDIADLNLDEDEKIIIRAALDTGKPVVVLMIAGRPRLLTGLYDEIDAFIWVGLAGTHAAQAITGVLSGEVNPSGKLPFSYPRYPSVWYPYNHKNFIGRSFLYDPEYTVWLSRFGEGLSYTTFDYNNLMVSDTCLAKNGSITATVALENTGEREGSETVLWYIHNEVSRITRPVRMLKHFEKQSLKPGEKREFSFEIIPDKHLWHPDSAGNRILEEGYFTIFVGDQKIRFKLLDVEQ